MPGWTPSKKQRKYYSGKKKRHTIKAQVVVNKATSIILCTAESCGKTHDFAIYKKTIGCRVLNSIKEQTDSGYQGIIEFHHNSETPKRSPEVKIWPIKKRRKIIAFLMNIFLLRISTLKSKCLKSWNTLIVIVENVIFWDWILFVVSSILKFNFSFRGGLILFIANQRMMRFSLQEIMRLRRLPMLIKNCKRLRRQ